MIFQSAVQTYECPMVDTRRQSIMVTKILQSLVSEKFFFQTVAKITLVCIFLVLGARLGIGMIVENIDKSIMLNEQECHTLIDQNIALRAEKAYLLSPQRIKVMAAEKLALFVADDGQIKRVN